MIEIVKFTEIKRKLESLEILIKQLRNEIKFNETKVNDLEDKHIEH